MADDLQQEEPPVKRLKLQELTTLSPKSTDTISNTNVSNENTPLISDEVAGCSKDMMEKENEDLERSSKHELDDSDNVSEISNLSGLSEESWKPTSGAMSWIQKQIMSGVNPRPILQGLIPDETLIPHDLDDFTLWKIVINIMSEPPARKKLSHINTFHDVIQLLQTCQNIMILTGAGVSVSCGIPDFRSRDGIYARLAVDFPDLPDPQAMFDINYFRNDPRPFFKFAKEIYPGQFEPSASHKFINTIEKKGKLLRNYTQNIDTLEQVAGISQVIQCHGSFATATCMVCKHKVDAEAVREDIFNQVIPKCPVCPPESPASIMKPDIVFFGESLSDEFHKQMTVDKDKCDLLIVIGSSLKVRPVALIPNSLPENVPQILINREPLKHLHFDVELLGNCDDIVDEICKHLNWDEKSRSPVLQEISISDLRTPTQSELGDTEENSIDKDEGQSSDDKSKDTVPPKVNGAPHSEEQSKSNVNSCSHVDSETPILNGCDTKENKSSTNQNLHHKRKSNEPSHKTISCDQNIAKNLKHGNNKGQLDNSKGENGDDLIDEEYVYSIEENKNKTHGHGKDNHKMHSKTEDTTKESEESQTQGDDQSAEEDDLEVMRSMWKPRHCSLAKRLGEKQYLFITPNRYVFSGAEVYSDMEPDSDSEYDSHSSYSSISENELESLENEVGKKESELGGQGDSCYQIDASIKKSSCQDVKMDMNGIDIEKSVLTNSGEGPLGQTKPDNFTTSAISNKPVNGLDDFHKTSGGMHQDYDELENLEPVHKNGNQEILKNQDSV